MRCAEDAPTLRIRRKRYEYSYRVRTRFKVPLRRHSDVGWHKVKSIDVCVAEKNEKPTSRWDFEVYTAQKSKGLTTQRNQIQPYQVCLYEYLSTRRCEELDQLFSSCFSPPECHNVSCNLFSPPPGLPGPVFFHIYLPHSSFSTALSLPFWEQINSISK